MLRYHFFKLGKEGWKAMVEAQELKQEPDPYHDRAWALFLQPYGLPEFTPPQLHSLAVRDLRAALDSKRIPNWALNLLTTDELEVITKP